MVSVSSTSYKRIRDLFDVTDKTIRDDLAYIQDVMGVIIESKPGVGGYVRISQEWRKRKCPMTPVQEQAMLTVYKAETNPELKMVLLGIMMCDKWNTGAGSWTRVIPHGKGRYWFCIS